MESLRENIDLIAGAAMVLLLAVAFWLFGQTAGKRCRIRTVLFLFASAVAALLLAALFMSDRLFWACMLPFPGVVVPGTSLLPGVAFIAGLLWSTETAQITRPRRRTGAGILLGLTVVQAVLPFLGIVPDLREIPRCDWSGGVCPQTSAATCSAASAATLLQAAGIPATESEMARLCLTRDRGTLMLGTYRGLRRKTEGTPFTVRVLSGADQNRLRQCTQENGPVLITVGLYHWQRGRIDPRYESLWGWTPGKRHAIVLFGFLPNGKLDIGDPAVGRERWSVESLSVLWHGEALQLIPSKQTEALEKPDQSDGGDDQRARDDHPGAVIGAGSQPPDGQ